jgi:hypothetical protein
MSGVDLYTVKEILGPKTLVMTQRYTHLSSAHQGHAVERLACRRGGCAKATDPITARAAAGAARGDDVTTEEKWWTGGELNSRHWDFRVPVSSFCRHEVSSLRWDMRGESCQAFPDRIDLAGLRPVS